MSVADGQGLMIADGGTVEHLSYEALRELHRGDSWWGLSVGFRALQLAGVVLSKDKLWDRQDLSVVSAHPGPGVRDAIEYVTRCTGGDRFRLSCPEAGSRCSRDMRFEWQVSDARRTLAVRLRPGFVAEAFFDVLDRLGTEAQRPDDRQRFDDYKRELSQRLWRTPLEDAFRSEVSESAVARHA